MRYRYYISSSSIFGSCNCTPILRVNIKGQSRANGIKFFNKGLYRAEMNGRSRADIKAWPSAKGIKFFNKGLYRADIKGRSRNMKGWPRANGIIFLIRACIGPI